jgi:hypothetical protein
MVTCHAILSRLEAYVDGELQPDLMLDVDCHLEHCRGCTARVLFERAFRASVRNATKRARTPTNALNRRIRKALIAERTMIGPTCFSATLHSDSVANTRNNRHPKSGRAMSDPTPRIVANRLGAPAQWQLSSWHLALPIAAIVLMVLRCGAEKTPDYLVTPATSSDLRLSQLDSMLDLMMEHHQSTWSQSAFRAPVRVSMEASLAQPFPLPPMNGIQSLRLRQRETGSPTLSPWPVALLGQSAHYVVDGHRVTFFMYRAQTAPLRARLEGRDIDGHVVYVGTHRGYSIATIETGPVGRAMISDFSSTQSAKLILSAVSNIGVQ